TTVCVADVGSILGMVDGPASTKLLRPKTNRHDKMAVNAVTPRHACIVPMSVKGLRFFRQRHVAHTATYHAHKVDIHPALPIAVLDVYPVTSGERIALCHRRNGAPGNNMRPVVAQTWAFTQPQLINDAHQDWPARELPTNCRVADIAKADHANIG